MNKYYKVKFPDNIDRYQWLMNQAYDAASDFMYGTQKQAMIYSYALFSKKNRLTDFLSNKNYELIEVCDLNEENISRIVDDLYW